MWTRVKEALIWSQVLRVQTASYELAFIEKTSGRGDLMTEMPLSNKIRLWVRFIHLLAFQSTAQIAGQMNLNRWLDGDESQGDKEFHIEVFSSLHDRYKVCLFFNYK